MSPSQSHPLACLFNSNCHLLTFPTLSLLLLGNRNRRSKMQCTIGKWRKWRKSLVFLFPKPSQQLNRSYHFLTLHFTLSTYSSYLKFNQLYPPHHDSFCSTFSTYYTLYLVSFTGSGAWNFLKKMYFYKI